jgi:hypothetical protein
MTLLNDRHPNELFRYIHVRGPQRASGDGVRRYFISNVYDQISRNELATIQRKNATLYPRLATRVGSPDQLAEQSADVEAYKKSKEYMSDPDHYALNYPELTSFMGWLDTHSSSAKLKAVRHRFKAAMGHDADGYVKSAEYKTLQCVFWDNLLASLFAPQNPLLITLACKHLAGLHVAEVVACDPDSVEPPSDLTRVYHAKPLVPKWVFEALAAARRDENPDEGVGDGQRPGAESRETLAARFNELDGAIREVRALIANRTEALRQESLRVTSADARPFARKEQLIEGRGASAPEVVKRPDAPARNLSSPYELTTGEQGRLGAATGQLVTQFFPEGGTLSLDLFLEKLLGEANAAAARLGSLERDYSVRIGDAILSRKEFCAEMIDRDPCATRPRREFITRGSYFNSASIGDLLVTKQQLIRYDTGEVAHVEAVMQGLEKERTHRRLDRTETTSTFERESINESERETQTTERFSMEKETAKTLEQDFKISTGTNFTASYGTVQFGAQLDASFGVSQSQTQKSATSFSKEVTSRALSRVKETVRETQTVTILHEIEETSVNKLANTTGDHVNGVYCWLEKFYLNKIFNYGRRLMFDFAFQEPASFYVFRKMTKPHEGPVVEKPAPPSDVVGPDGLRLTSPAVLTDANFGFWVAQYEAANVEAPPQEYVTISKAFKNAYAIDQNSLGNIYESMTGQIEIPAGYEAVVAQGNIDAFDMGSNGFVNAMIVTTPFGGPGYTGNILLPNVRTEVAFSVFSFIVNFVCNVAVKATRSPESYNSWKLTAYDKIIEAYNRKKQAYEEWLNAQHADTTFGFSGGGNNPLINRATEREELKKRCLELFTGQRFESFDAATNGIQNVSGYPEILFRECITEGNLVRFFEQAIDWKNMTYIFDDYFYGRKHNWLALKNLEDGGDPLFTKFLQAGYARVLVPARPGFENYLLLFNLLSNLLTLFVGGWVFDPTLFGAAGLSNDFIPGINDPVYMSVAQELIDAESLDDEDPANIIGHYVQKVPTNLVYVVPNGVAPGSPLPGLPDNSADPEIQPYI